jgi:RNA polymerase sigma factor (sigma-70 family)
MGAASASLTSSTLLGRLRSSPTDQAAWNDFVQRYGPKIYRWCRQWDLQEADAQDAAQNVLVKLAGRMRAFEYDPARSFRAWLKVVTQSVVSDFLAERARAGRALTLQQLDTAAARDSLLQHLQEEFDLELFEEAMARVQLRLAAHRWEVFRLTAIEGLPGVEVAARLRMKVATVFAAKSAVQRLVRKELRRLEGSGPD